MSRRHRASTPVRSRTFSTATRGAITALGLTAAFVAVPGTASAHSAAGGDDFAKLRACESSGNYSVNTGNGYYGAYQFDLSTWRSVGGTGYPHQASPATQDALAAELQSRRGWSPWPVCSAKLGLGSGGSSVAATTPVRSTPAAVASRSQSRVSSSSSSYGGTVLTTRFVNSYRSDVQALQARLAGRGFTLAVDGFYGPQTAGAVTAFQRSAGIAVDGAAGPQTWGAAF